MRGKKITIKLNMNTAICCCQKSTSKPEESNAKEKQFLVRTMGEEIPSRVTVVCVCVCVRVWV